MDRMVVSVDIACFTLAPNNTHLNLLLIQRTRPPFAHAWALPGGTVLPDEPLDHAAARLLSARTGLQDNNTDPYLEQLYTFGDPGRDPRGRTLSVTYYALLPNTTHHSQPGQDVQATAWHPVDQLPPLAFDHHQIAHYARRRLAQKITYTPLLFHSLGEPFTLGDLRALHEAIDGKHYDPSNFQKQMLARWDLAPVPGIRDRRTRRPARLYRYIGSRDIPGPPDPVTHPMEEP